MLSTSALIDDERLLPMRHTSHLGETDDNVIVDCVRKNLLIRSQFTKNFRPVSWDY